MGASLTIANKSTRETKAVNVDSNVRITNYAEGKKGNNAIEIFVQDGNRTITGTDGNGKPTGTKGGLRSADFNSRKYDLMNKLIDLDTTDGNDTLSESDLIAAMKKGIASAKVIADENCDKNGKYTVKFNNGEVLTFDFERKEEKLAREAAITSAKNEVSDNNTNEMKKNGRSDLENLLVGIAQGIKNLFSED